MIFICNFCGCALYSPFKSYCDECNKVRRIMLLSDKVEFVAKLESMFLKKDTKDTKITNIEDIKISVDAEKLKRSKTTEDLTLLDKNTSVRQIKI